MQQMRAAGGGGKGSRAGRPGRGAPGAEGGPADPPSRRPPGPLPLGVSGREVGARRSLGGLGGVRKRFGGGCECMHGFGWGEDGGFPRSGIFFCPCARVRCCFRDEF